MQVYRARVDKLKDMDRDKVKDKDEDNAKVDPAISLNIRNVQRLRIIVQSSNLLDLHDHATLADARVIQ